MVGHRPPPPPPPKVGEWRKNRRRFAWLRERLPKRPDGRRVANFLGPVLGVAIVLGITAWLLRDTRTFTLRWKLHKGQVLRYRDTSHCVFWKGVMDSTIETTYTVTAVDPDGTYRITGRMESYETTRRGGGPDLDYSSKRGDPPPDDFVVRPMAAVLGIPRHIRMDGRGKGLESGGWDEFQRAWREGVGEEDFMGMMAELPFSGSQEDTASPFIFPAEPTGIGDSWSREFQWGTRLVGFKRSRVTYTLAEVRGDVAVIEETEETLEETPGTLQEMVPDDPGKPQLKQEVEQSLIHEFSLSRGVLLGTRREARARGTDLEGKPYENLTLDDTRLVD